MRVLMTADAVGGVWTYALDLSRELTAGGADVTLAVLGPSASAEQADSARQAGVSLIDTRLPLDWLSDSEAEVLAAGAALSRLAAEVGADVLHLNHPALGAAYDGSAPTIAVAHSCVATWWEAVKGDEPLPADFSWRTALVDEGYRRAARVVAPSHAFAEATRTTYALARTPEAIWNGRRPLGRESSGAPVPEVFTAGRLWDEGKDLATLDRAAARLDAPVHAAGPTRGPNGAAVSLNHARPLGSLTEPELAARFAARPVFASAALYEPFGLTALEAAQAGCALVLADIPTFRELWDGAAVFFPPRDDVAAAEAIAAVLDDTSRREAMGLQARERAGRYGVGRMADAVRALYAAVRTPEPVH